MGWSRAEGTEAGEVVPVYLESFFSQSAKRYLIASMSESMAP
jgi:hypothetical protein